MSWERKMEELTISIVEYVGARKEMIELYPCLQQCGIFVSPFAKHFTLTSFSKACVKTKLVVDIFFGC